MSKELPSNFFDDVEPAIGVTSFSTTPTWEKGEDRLPVTWLQDRSEAFQIMTGGRGKPMNYGFNKKEK